MKTPKPTKTFPLEIAEDLHKRLKIEAIKEDKSLHSLIIDTLVERVQEKPGMYEATPTKEKRK